MRDICVLFVFFASIAATVISGACMLNELMVSVFDGARFAASAVAFIISAVFFWFVRDEVVY